MVEFFGAQTARELAARAGKADLLLGNNVLAHVPDLNDFVAGMQLLLKPAACVTFEFPHLLQLMRAEPVRHDLPRALLLFLVARRSSACSRAHGLTLFDVEELPTHGGSLRIFAGHADDASRSTGARARR